MIPNNVTNPMVEISELLARTTRNIKFDNVNFFQKIFGRRPGRRPNISGGKNFTLSNFTSRAVHANGSEISIIRFVT